MKPYFFSAVNIFMTNKHIFLLYYSIAYSH